MAWGIVVGMLVVMALFAFLGLVIFQEARTHRFWRHRVEAGDLEMIGQLVRAEVERWRIERPPKGTPAGVWGGIQGVELVEVGSDYVRASSTAETQFALVGGSRRQVSSALDEAKRISARLAERFLYDIPHVRPERLQIDIYTTFHELGGEAEQRCILSTLVRRDDVIDIDWESDPPETIAERLGARYHLDARGEALPIELDDEAARAVANGSPPDGGEALA